MGNKYPIPAVHFFFFLDSNIWQNLLGKLWRNIFNETDNETVFWDKKKNNKQHQQKMDGSCTVLSSANWYSYSPYGKIIPQIFSHSWVNCLAVFLTSTDWVLNTQIGPPQVWCAPGNSAIWISQHLGLCPVPLLIC